MKKVIFHVDVNSAFLSWEACYRIHHLGGKQDLRQLVSAVGGDQEKRHGIILAKSIPAKKYHIQTGETVVSAKEKCPDLVLVPPNYDLYNRSSKALIKLLSEYTDKIEQYSIDEAFLDMTGCCQDPITTAYEIKNRVHAELGFTVNIGVSENKLLACGPCLFIQVEKIGISYDWRTGSYGSCNFARAYEVTGNTYLAICKWYR